MALPNAKKPNVVKTLKRNSKNLLGAFLLLVAGLLQNCKKEAANSAAAPPKEGMYALINDTAWTAVTVSASLEYNVSTGKTFTCTGTMGNRVIQLTAVQNNVAAGNMFPVGPANGNLSTFAYFVLPVHRNLVEQSITMGTTPGASLVITAIDPATQLISGTFAFPQADSVYDAFDNVIAVQNNRITNGFFKQVHYVYKP